MFFDLIIKIQLKFWGNGFNFNKIIAFLLKKVYSIPMKCLFVANPESGKGKIVKKKDYIISRLKQKFEVVDYVQTERAGHLTEIIEERYANYDCVVVSGGDGTVNETVTALAEKPNAPIIGYIPSGTVNDVARTLGISRNVKKAVDIIINGKPFEYDIMKINQRYGIYVCGFGMFTTSSYKTKQSAKRKMGKFAYVLDSVKEFFVSKPINFEFESSNKCISGATALALFINSRSVAGMRFNKDANLQDGTVDVVVFLEKKKRVSFATKLRIFKMFLFGINSVKKSKQVEVFECKSARVKVGDAVVNLDGENGGQGDFDLDTINKGITIYARN